jgi:hypothetical protein
MDKRFRAHLISIAVMLIGVLLSGLFFFLSWIFKDRFAWAAWLPPVSYASFLGAALIAFLIQLGIRYDFARSRVIGFILVIGWIAASLLTTALDALRIVSAHLARGLSGDHPGRADPPGHTRLRADALSVATALHQSQKGPPPWRLARRSPLSCHGGRTIVG